MSNPTDTDKHGISLVIPAYNEEVGIGPVIDALTQYMQSLSVDYEIIVVDDGSRDGTSKVLAAKQEVKLYTHQFNQGYGAALKTGIRHAQYPLICITDADGTYPNERIGDLYRYMQENKLDMVVGARTGDNVQIPIIRKPAKWAINKLANFVAGHAIADINSGLRIFNRKISLRFFPLLPDGFSFTTTITLAMMTNNFQVGYMPIDYYARVGKSKIKPIRDTLNFVQLILRMALYFAPMKIFLSLSVILFIIAFLWGVFSIVFLGAFADNSTFLIAITSLQSAMIGLLAELINHRIPSLYREDEE